MKTLLTLVAAMIATAVLAVPASADGPGAAAGPSAPSERYIPFVTDFPQQHPEAVGPGVAADTSAGFDGLDAALGAAVGLAVGALGAASLPALRRRRTLSSA